uniref:Uncharacterized protein n=1 Tax=Arundo donax TaxID=35708 RepID=A0A0A9B4K3_ARUDO
MRHEDIFRCFITLSFPRKKTLLLCRTSNLFALNLQLGL